MASFTGDAAYDPKNTVPPVGAPSKDPRSGKAEDKQFVDEFPFEVTEADRIGCVFPFTHVAGAVYIFSALAYGCTMLVVEAFEVVGAIGVSGGSVEQDQEVAEAGVAAF